MNQPKLNEIKDVQCSSPKRSARTSRRDVSESVQYPNVNPDTGAVTAVKLEQRQSRLELIRGI